MIKFNNEILLYVSPKRKIFFVLSVLKKDFQFFEKVFYKSYIRNKPKFENLCSLLIFLEITSKFQPLRELVKLLKPIFLKRPLFRISFIEKLHLTKFEIRKKILALKFFRDKRNFHWFFFQNNFQKRHISLIKLKKNLDCSYSTTFFKNFFKLLLVRRGKFWDKIYFYQPNFSLFSLKSKISDLMINQSSTKIHYNSVKKEAYKDAPVFKHKKKVDFLDFYSLLFIEIQFVTKFILKHMLNSQIKNKHYLSIISIFKFLKKISKKSLIQEKQKIFSEEFFSWAFYLEIVFNKLFIMKLNYIKKESLFFFQFEKILGEKEENFSKCYTNYFFNNFIRSNKTRLICQYFFLS